MHATSRIVYSAPSMLLACFFLLLLATGLSQSHELAATVGGHFPANATFDLHPGFAVEGTYAGRLLHVPTIGLYWELPGAYSPKVTGTFVSFSGVERRHYSSLFITPGLRLKIAPELPLSPFIALGVGVAHFNIAATPVSAQKTDNTTVLQIGGGLDWKIVPFFNVRGELRDFYSGNPAASFLSSVPGIGTITRQHNILPTVGLVLKF